MSGVLKRIIAMRVITKKRIQDFCLKHPEAHAPLSAWYRISSNSNFANPTELKRTFQQVDYVDGLFVFNAGKGYRLVVFADFRAEIFYIRHVMTHAEYDRGKWKRK
jgi:mRNA interferase HigB